MCIEIWLQHFNIVPTAIRYTRGWGNDRCQGFGSGGLGNSDNFGYGMGSSEGRGDSDHSGWGDGYSIDGYGGSCEYSGWGVGTG